MTDREGPSLASAALRATSLIPRTFGRRSASTTIGCPKRTVERLIDDGLLGWGNASRTLVVLTERGRALDGD